MSGVSGVRIEPWGPDDLPLLEKVMGDPRMTEHLGGPETAAQLARRHVKYERLAASGGGRMFKIVDEATGEAAGTVGYWDKRWNDEDVYETGWSVLPELQGRGIAVAATALALERAAADGRHRFVYAYPSVDNAASNAICRKLGFELVEEREFEYPPGHPMTCNVWRLELPLV
jgi:RimJ/RimL family protein N-acetyltransferase